SHASLSLAEWRKVRAVFRPRAKDAKTERRQIAQAVALMERLVGPKTGTGVHQWTHKNELIYPNMGDPTQLDCVDESVNTWTYMTMMERGNLLRFHQVADLSNAGGLTDPFMRNTAVLKEKGGAYYAIDASLVDYGKPPPVMLLATWMGSWPPDLSKAEAVAKTDGHRPRTTIMGVSDRSRPASRTRRRPIPNRIGRNLSGVASDRHQTRFHGAGFLSTAKACVCHVTAKPTARLN
ncbi:MAG: hypothetical protein P8Y71_16025, partial [Pseudolabrys sp.]